MASSNRGPRLDSDKAGALAAQHERIDRLVSTLRTKIQRGDHAAVVEVWDQLEHDIEHHLSLEESDLLPRYHRFEPGAASTVLSEHSAIRAAIGALAAQVELGTVKEEIVDRLAKQLEDHADQERRGFYPWTEQRLMTWVWVKVRRATTGKARHPHE